MVERLIITSNHKEALRALLKIAFSDDDLPAAEKANDRLLKEFKMLTGSLNKEKYPSIVVLMDSILLESKESASKETRLHMERLLNLL